MMKLEKLYNTFLYFTILPEILYLKYQDFKKGFVVEIFSTVLVFKKQLPYFYNSFLKIELTIGEVSMKL